MSSLSGFQSLALKDFTVTCENLGPRREGPHQHTAARDPRQHLQQDTSLVATLSFILRCDPEKALNLYSIYIQSYILQQNQKYFGRHLGKKIHLESVKTQRPWPERNCSPVPQAFV